MVHQSSKREVRERPRAASSSGSADVIPLPGKKAPPPAPGFENEETAQAMGESPFEEPGFQPPPLPTRPKLEVVPNKASWPFAPEQKPERSISASRPRIKQKTPARPRTDSKLVVWNEADRKHDTARKNDPDRKDRTSDRRVPTAVHAVLPVSLPPATEETNSRAIRARRSESVIAEAEAMRGGVGKKISVLSRRASTSFRDAMAGGFEVASYLGEGSIRAVRKFESMPRRRQILWVATPYAVVILLVLLLVHLRSPDNTVASSTVQMKRPLTETDAQIAPPVQRMQAAAQVTPEPQPIPVPDPAPVLVKEEPKRIEVTAKISGTWQEVQALTFLRSRAEAKGAKVSRLDRGQKVVIYHEMPAKDGWLVAQKPGAELGFLKASALEPRPETAEKPVKKIVFKKKKAKKKKRLAWPQGL
jgi:hypothetical protein